MPSGFLDIHMKREWTVKRLSKGGKVRVTVGRSGMMQELLEELVKSVGKPCKACLPNCISCEAWIAFSRLDEILLLD